MDQRGRFKKVYQSEDDYKTVVRNGYGKEKVIFRDSAYREAEARGDLIQPSDPKFRKHYPQEFREIKEDERRQADLRARTARGVDWEKAKHEMKDKTQKHWR